MKRLVALTALSAVLAGAACRAADGPETAPVTFQLANNCAAFDADRSWTFYIDDQKAADATLPSGGAVTIQVALGNRKVGWSWNRVRGTPVQARGPTYITAARTGTNAVNIPCI